MLVIQLLLLIYSCLLVRSESLVEEPINGVSLDISSLNSQNVAVEEGTLYGIAYKSFLLGGNHYFSRVSEAGVAVWTNEKSTDGRDRCTAVNVFKREGHSPLLTLYNNGLGLSCFLKDGSKWKGIGVEEFDLKYTGMRAGSRTLEEHVTLDIGNFSASLVDVYENLVGGVLQNSFFPKESFFSEVSQYGDLIWDGFGEEKCSMAFYRFRKGTASLALQVVRKGQKSGFKYFKNLGFGWLSIREEDFDLVNEKITGTTPPKTSCTLDLSSVNPKDFLMDTDTSEGINDLMYMPRHDKIITSVVDHSEILWVAQPGERCTLAFSDQKGDTTLLDLHIKTEKDEYTFKHFEKFGAAWTQLSFKEYEEKLNEMKTFDEIPLDDKKLVLNISEFSPYVQVDEDVKLGTSHTSFTPKPGYAIKAVMDGNDVVWVAESQEVCLIAQVSSKDGHSSLLSLFIDTPYGTCYGCFIKDGTTWKSISKGEYNERIKEMEELPKTAKKLLLEALEENDKVTLDLAKPDETKIEILDVEVDGALLRRFTPKDPSYISKVVDTSVVGPEANLWTTGESEKCVAVGSYSKDTLFFIAVQIQTGDDFTFKYFEKVEGRWEDLNEVQLSDRLEVFNFYLQEGSNPTTAIPFDIFNVDKRIISYDSYHSGVYQKQFAPKRGFHLSSVMEGENHIWETSGREKCTGVNLYNAGDLSFITLWLKDGKEITIKRFEHVEGNWEELTVEAFTRRLREIRSNEEDMKYKESKLANVTVLDLSNPNKTNFAIHEETHFKVLEREYSPKGDLSIAAVTDGHVTIWVSGDHSKCEFADLFSIDSSTIVYLRITNTDGSTKPVCFEKNDGEWTSITEINFFKTLDAMMGKYGKGSFEGITLDISNPNQEKVTFLSGKLGGANHFVFRTKKDGTFTKVVEGSTTIWTAKPHERCGYVSKYSTEDATLVYLNRKRNGEFRPIRFEKMNGKWIRVSKTAFLRAIEKMTQSSSSTPTTPTTSPDSMDVSTAPSSQPTEYIKLDISRLSTSGYLPTDKNGLKHREYIPKEGHRVIALSDGDKTLWTEQEGETCIFASFSYTDDGVTRAYLDILKGDEFKPLSFEKSDDEWNEVSYKQIDKEIEDLMDKRRKDADTKASTSCVIDIASPNKSEINFSTEILNGIVYRRYSPKENVSIHMLMDSNFAIWSSGSGESCRFVKSYTDGDYVLLALGIRTTSGYLFKYFMKDNVWVPLSKEDFANNLEILLNQYNEVTTPAPPTSTATPVPSSELTASFFTLDIMNPDESKVTVYNRIESRIKYRGYDPKNGHYISSIVEGPVTVWRSEFGEKCIAATLSTNGKSTLMAVYTMHNNTFDYKHYENVDGVWNVISLEDFHRKVGELVGLPNSTLDISYKSEATIIDHDKDSGLTQHGYVPKTDNVTSVVDGTHALWFAKKGERCEFVNAYFKDGFAILYISIKKDSEVKFRYFGKGENGWEVISREDYYDILWKFSHFGDKLVPTSTSTTINIEHPDPLTTHAFINDYNGREYTCGTFTPREGFVASSIVDSDGQVWKGGEDERCVFLAVYYGNGSTIANITVNRGLKLESVHLERIDRRWVEIPNRLFFDILKRIIGTTFTLDISSPNPKKVEVYDREIKGVKHRTFFPNRALQLSTIVDGETTVWKAGDGERCTAATMSSRNDTHLLLVHVKNGDLFDFLYFEKDAFGWKNTDRDSFYNALRDLMESSTARTESVGVSLNLAKPEKNLFVETGDYHGVNFVSYSPHNGHTISSVSSSKTMLWRGKHGDKCKYVEVYTHSKHSLIYMRVKRSSMIKSLRFAKKGNKWVKVNRRDFSRRLRAMMTYSKQEMMEFKEEHPITLDLSNVDLSKVSVYEDKEDGPKYRQYTPKKDVVVSAVRDGNFKLWTSQNGEDCSLVGRHSHQDTELLSVYIRYGDNYEARYFISGNGWTEITKKAFLYKLNMMKISKKKATCVVDISNPNLEALNLLDDVFNGVHYRRYYPKYAVPVTKVVDSDFTLWKSGSDSKCIVTNLYTHDDSTLLLLYITGSEKSRFKYFEKIDGEWIGITEEEFDERLNSFKCGEIPSTSKGNVPSSNVESHTQEIVLDLTSPNQAEVFAIDTKYSDLENWKFAAYDEFSIAKVVNGSETFWEAGSGKKGTFVDFLKKGGEPVLFSVIPDEPSGSFFERRDGKWVSVDAGYYEKKFNEYYRNAVYGELDLD